MNGIGVACGAAEALICRQDKVLVAMLPYVITKSWG